MEQFAMAVYAFCAINAKRVVYDKAEDKRICWDNIVNCAITSKNFDGNKLLKECQTKYLKTDKSLIDN